MGEKEKQKHLTRAVRGNLGGLLEAVLDSPVRGMEIRRGVVINRGLRAVSLSGGKEMQVDIIGPDVNKRSDVWVYNID